MKKRKASTETGQTKARAANTPPPLMGISIMDAIDLLLFDVTKVEATSAAAVDAIDHYGVPTSVSSRNYARLQALIDTNAEQTTALARRARGMRRTVHRLLKTTGTMSRHVAGREDS